MQSLELLIALTELITEQKIEINSVEECIAAVRTQLKPLADECDALELKIAELHKQIEEGSQLTLLSELPLLYSSCSSQPRPQLSQQARQAEVRPNRYISLVG